MKSKRSKLLISLACLSDEKQGSLTAGKNVFMDIEVSYNDGKVAACMGRPITKGYRTSCQVRTQDRDNHRFYSLVGGWGANFLLKESGRFNANTLSKLLPTSEHVKDVIHATTERSGITLSNAGKDALRDFLPSLLT